MWGKIAIPQLATASIHIYSLVFQIHAAPPLGEFAFFEELQGFMSFASIPHSIKLGLMLISALTPLGNLIFQFPIFCPPGGFDALLPEQRGIEYI